MTIRHILRAAAAVFALIAIAGVAYPALTQTRPNGPDPDHLAAHELLWLDATAATLAIAAVENPAAQPVAEFKRMQTRLERAVVRLIGSRPPLESLADHLALLPVVQEVTAAARALVDAMEAQDQPGIASANVWLGESLARLALATREARNPRR